MYRKNHQIASTVTDIIRESVTTTISTLFNVPINASQTARLFPSPDDFVCCGELIQDASTSARLMFLFDRELIELLVHCAFPGNSNIDPSIYESTALEIVNIVSNNLKMYLNVHGYNLRVALPYVVDRSGGPVVDDSLVKLVFSSKESAVMGVDFYLRSA